MGVQATLKDIQSGFLSAASLNANNSDIISYFDKTLDRTSNTNNQMHVDLDMGTNKIFNLKDAVSGQEAINYSQLQRILAAGTGGYITVGKETTHTATAGQTLVSFSDITYKPGTNNLSVYVNGVRQTVGDDYLETSSSSITFVSALQAGDLVNAYTNDATTSVVSDAQNVSYTHNSVTESVASFLSSLDTTLRSDLASTYPGKGAALVGLTHGTAADAINYFTPEMFGAVGYTTKSAAEAGKDSAAAIQNAINYCRDNSAALCFSPRAFYRIGVTVKSQHDTNYSAVLIFGNGATLVKDFAGTGFEISGGSVPTEARDLYVDASSSYEATDFLGTFNASTHVITPTYSEHGFHVVNTKAILRRCAATHNRGAGLRIESTALNGNLAEFDVSTGQNGVAGIYISGSNDNLSVIPATFRSYGDYGPAIHVEDDVHLRDWDLWIYAEACCSGASASGAGLTDQVYIGKAIASDFWIYSENNLGFGEIKFGANTEANRVKSARGNLDLDRSTTKSNTWRHGNRIYVPDSSRQNDVCEFYSEYARLGVGGEWVRVPIRGNGGVYGYLKGEVSGIQLSSPNGTEIGVADGVANIAGKNVFYNPTVAPNINSPYEVIFSGVVNSGTSTTVPLAASANIKAISLNLSLSGIGSGNGGDSTLVQSMYVKDGTLSAAAAQINDIQAPLAASVSINGTTNDLELILSYPSGGWGGSSKWSVRAEVQAVGY